MVPDHWSNDAMVSMDCCGLTAFVVSMAMIFVISVKNTLRGFAALMKKKPNEDGTVNDPKMLDGVRGKLKEVVCEAAPQSNLQVRSSYPCDACCRKYSTYAFDKTI